MKKEGDSNDDFDSLIAIISLVLTAFGLGYTIGSNSTKK